MRPVLAGLDTDRKVHDLLGNRYRKRAVNDAKGFGLQNYTVTNKTISYM